MRLALCLLLCTITVAGNAPAQSPYDLRWPREGWIAGGGLLLGAASLRAGHTQEGLTPSAINALSRSSLNAFDRGATLQFSADADAASDWLVYGLLATPPLLLLDTRARNDWTTLSVMYAETMLLTAASVQLVKNIVDRPRPFVYNDAAPLSEKTAPDARRSFYSSHTAFAFASATFLSSTYAAYFPDSRWVPYVWTGSLLAAAGVGLLRYSAGMHFPGDILVGAAAGTAVGWLIPLVHRTDNDDLRIGFVSTGPRHTLRLSLRL